MQGVLSARLGQECTVGQCRIPQFCLEVNVGREMRMSTTELIVRLRILRGVGRLLLKPDKCRIPVSNSTHTCFADSSNGGKHLDVFCKVPVNVEELLL